MANASYDTLTITINADSKEANRSIKNLSNNLNKLNDSATKLNTRRLGEVKGLLLNIAKIDFSNVSKGLQDVVSAFKYFQSKTAQKVAPIINPKDFDKQIKSYQNVAGKDFNFSFLGSGNTTQSELTNTIEQARSLLEVVKELNLTGEQNKIIFQELGLSVNALQEEKFSSVAKALEKAGVQGEKIKSIIDKLNESLNDLKDTTGKTSSGFARMFKNIIRYRVVRKIIQSVFQEITEAFSELANVDKDFDQSLGEIKSAFSYIGRVLVSVIAPIVKAIAPIITMIAQAIGSIFTEMGSALAGALGQDEFAEAQENVESYTESMNKAKSVATGIDKLNIISNDKNDGNFKMTDATKMSGELGNLFNKISEKLKPLLQELIPQIANILVNVIKAVERIAPLLTLIIDLVADFVSMTDDSVNGSIATFVDMIGGVLGDLGTILQTLKPILDIVNMINAVVLNLINDGIGLIANIIQSLFGFITTIFETLVAFVNGDFDKIDELWDKLLDRLGEAWSHWFESICRGFYKGFQKIAKLLGTDLPDMPSSTIKSYATGGFPEDGIFMANHNELVGQFSNGKTAVANNQQITQGIYQAVLQAMRESGSGNISVQLDGQEVAKIITKRQNNFGSDLVKGGNINYGKRL